MQKHSRRLAVLESMDNGKSIRESRDIDIPLVARHFYHHAGWAQLLGDLTESGFDGEEFRGYTPVGVVGQIIPWNFPLLMFAWKVAPALAAGNTVVIKPAEFTPLTAIAIAEIADEVGLPKGVLNVINGDGSTGAAIVEHPDIDKIAFTGSTEVGRIIRKATAKTPKKLSLELGGKSPFIVFDDADLDSAVEGLVDGIWFNQGQVCCAGSRLLVQERVAETLYDKIRARMETLRVGSPFDKAIDIGAIVDQVQYDRIQKLVAMGIAEGATCWQPEIPMPKNGLFIKPTLLTDVHPSSTVAQQEIFGPVLASMTFRTPAEAVELANNTTYGLAACVWSESINVALDVAAQVKAGVVWVNSTNLFDAACGFGGYRESGYGREGGKEGMFEYLVPAWTHQRAEGSRSSPKPAIDSPTARGQRRRLRCRHRPHREAVHRRQAGAARLRLQLPRLQPRRQAGRRGPARQPQGHPQRRRGRRSRRRQVGQGCRSQPRAGALLHRREPHPAPRRDRPQADRLRRRSAGRGRVRLLRRAAPSPTPRGATSSRARSTTRPSAW